MPKKDYTCPAKKRQLEFMIDKSEKPALAVCVFRVYNPQNKSNDGNE